MVKTKNRYIKLLILAGLALASCKGGDYPDVMKWNISLEHTNKRPYGDYLAFESLKYFFPGAQIKSLPNGTHYKTLNDWGTTSSARSLLILVGTNFKLSEEEWREMCRFMMSGNEIILFCNQLDPRISGDLNNYEINEYYGDIFKNSVHGSDNQNVLSVVDSPELKYGYNGREIKNYFADGKVLEQVVHEDISNNPDTPSAHTNDSLKTASVKYDSNKGNSPNDTEVGVLFYGEQVLGMAGSHPDFLRYSIGNGHLTLHAAPLALSNYFLLQQNNINYLTAIWNSLPADIGQIYWDDYRERHIETAGYEILWRIPATKAAILLALLTGVAFVIFESKRKQRQIPVIPPLKNESVSFVETVGRLYYNKGNHENLAEKMVQQFLEFVRNRYLLSTNILDGHFVKQLTLKSAQPEAVVKELIDMIGELRTGNTKPDEAYLYALYRAIHTFYDQNKYH